MMKKDSKYMKKHLKDYIVFQIGQGYDPSDIKELLLKYGYNEDSVKEIFDEIGNVVSGHERKTTKKMSKDLYKYVEGLLVDFILKEMEQGYSMDAIRKALINFGHEDYIVDSAIAHISGEKSKKITYDDLMEPEKGGKKAMKGIFPTGFLYMVSLAILFTIVVMLAMFTETDMYLIFMSFFPSMIGVTVTYFTIMQLKLGQYVKMMPFIAVMVTVLMFAVMFLFDSKILSLPEPGTVGLLNAIAVFILTSVMCLLGKIPHLGEKIEEYEKIPVEKEHPGPDTALQEELDIETDKLEKMLEKEFPQEPKKGKKEKLKKI